MHIKNPNVPEKLSHWLVSNFNTTTSEIVVPFRGTISINDVAVNRMFRLPMGVEEVEYVNKIPDNFYDTVGKSKSKKAPSFIEEEKWLVHNGRGKIDDVWLRRWVLFWPSAHSCAQQLVRR